MVNKKILGLDIGTTSIGWAIVEASSEKPFKYNEYFNDGSPETKTDTNNQRIGIHKGKDGLPAAGVRIIPQGDIGQRFDSGKKLNEGKKHTPTAERRIQRSARKTKSRYKLRRDKLCSVLEILGMLPDDSYQKVLRNGKKIWKPIEEKNNKWYTNKREYEHDEFGIKKKKREMDIGEQLYKLRTDALNKDNEIGLKDWGRILLHLNQWRGYSSDRFSSNEEETKGIKSGDVEVYTTTVSKVFPSEIYDEKNILFKIVFENGQQGYEVRNNDKEKSNFIEGGLVSYYFEKKEDERDGYKKIKFREIDKTSWAYRKKEINDSIESYLNENQQQSVGSYFYQKHYSEKSLTRIRTNTINRGWYEDEFDKIWKVQFEKYAHLFTEDLINSCINSAFKDEQIKKEIHNLKINGISATAEQKLKHLIKDKIIYFQRSWQQTKNKGECRFEKIPDIKKDKDGKVIPHKDGKDHWKGRTVIPKSHPLHQEFKIWQQINNVRLWYHCPEGKFELFTEKEIFNAHSPIILNPVEVKEKLYEHLQIAKTSTWRTFAKEKLELPFDVLIDEEKKKKTTKGRGKNKGNDKVEILTQFYSVNFSRKTKKGEIQDNPLKGNFTKYQIQDVLHKEDESWYNRNAITGEDKHNAEKLKDKLVSTKSKGAIPFNYQTKEYEVKNLQLLWEIVYDITNFQAGNEKANIENITKKIRKYFTIEIISDEQCVLLAKIKFDDGGMGNLSAKAIRKLLPLMADGKYALQYPFNEKVKSQIDGLIKLNQEEQNETNDDLKLYSLKDFITDKKARIKLSQKKSNKEFRGLNYWEAAAVVYGNHSKAGITNRSINEIEEAIKNLQPVKPSSMNNPVVEKIVNETLKMVQLLYQTYQFDELRIELSRELKNSREEREAIWEAQNNNKQRNDFAKKMLREMFNGEDTSQLDLSTSSNNIDKIKIIEDVVSNLKSKEHIEKKKEYKISEPTKADVIKYRLWLDQEFKCPYTNRNIPFSDVFAKEKKVQREHIIPKERYRDNSFSNIVLTWVEVNSAKAENGNRTAFEFIDSKRDREKVIVAGKGELPLVSKEQWESHVKSMFKGRKAKNLLRKTIPEDPINRELKETQYINKKLREKLGEIFGFDKVWTTTGQITDMLRNAWHLNDKVMQELVRERFEKFKPPMGKGTTMESIPEYDIIYDNTIIDKNTNEEKVEKEFPNFSKRLDHRHHALDAIIVACTRQQHIQYINNLNAANSVDINNDDALKAKYTALKTEICEGNSSNKYKTPWQTNDFIPAVIDALQNIIISHKNSNVLISPSKNKQIDANNYTSISIRQKLHQETLVGKRKIYDKTLISIEEIVEMIFEKRKTANKSFTEIIASVVFKEKFQKQLFHLFEKYNLVKDLDDLKSKVIHEISESKSEYFEAATILKEIPVKRDSKSISSVSYKDVIDKRTQRHLKYRQDWMEELEEEWKKYKNERDSEERKIAEQRKKWVNNLTDFPIYYNALYDVRIKDGNWLSLFEFNKSMIDHIEYIKYRKGEKKIDNSRTEQIKNLIKNYQHEFNRENTLLKHPLFTNENKKIVIKKTTVENWVGNESLIEIRPKTFVATEGKFRVIVTESNEAKKEKHFKFIDHLTALNFIKDLKEHPEKEFIKAEFNIPKEKILNGDRFLFTLSKQDLIYIPNEVDIVPDWNNIKSLSDNLYIVSSFDEKNEYIILEKHSIAEPIKLDDINDAHGLKIKLLELQEYLKKENEEYLSEADRLKPIQNEIEQLKKANNKDDVDVNREDKKQNKEKIKELQGKIKPDELLLKEHKNEITLKEKEISKLQSSIAFKMKDDNPAPPIEETTEIKYDGKKQNIIKVFTYKLGKKVVPYWEFPNGCWDKEKAMELGLINS
ncbi:MAG TPA: HNH endonuclease domain-containing protein [Hanamia sp.]